MAWLATAPAETWLRLRQQSPGHWSGPQGGGGLLICVWDDRISVLKALGLTLLGPQLAWLEGPRELAFFQNLWACFKASPRDTDITLPDVVAQRFGVQAAEEGLCSQVLLYPCREMWVAFPNEVANFRSKHA
ncbi:UNVERIFIED_CONTAM: hypothetical protein FKN15_034791 [Acipenser sinensis]